MRKFTLLLLLLPILTKAQTRWNPDGNSYTTIEDNAIVEITLPAMTKTTLVTADQLAPLNLATREHADRPQGRRGGGAFSYDLSADHQEVLLYTKPVYIYHDAFYACWLFNRKTAQLTSWPPTVPRRPSSATPYPPAIPSTPSFLQTATG